MVDLVPELKLIIGEQPPVPELPPQDAQRRFQLVFRRFIGVFARPEHPLALFLDDLQWLDAATLDLLEDLLTQSGRAAPAADRRLSGQRGRCRPSADAQARSDPGRRREVSARSRLRRSTRDDLGQLIADALRCEPERAAPLAQLVHEKTGGNPFFAIQFLSALAEEGLLTFDHDAGALVLGPRSHSRQGLHRQCGGPHGREADPPAGRNAEVRCSSLPVSATSPRSRRFRSFSETSERAGPRGSVGGGPSGADRALGGLLQVRPRPRPGSRLFADPGSSCAPRRICESGGCSRRTRLPRSGRRRSSRSSISSTAARRLITSRDEREQLAELNLIAGKRAKASTAYASALNYLAAGAALLPEDCWERRHELAFRAGAEPGRMRVPDRRAGGSGGALGGAFNPRRKTRRTSHRRVPARGSVHDPRSERPRGRRLSRLPPASRHRLVAASDRRGSATRIRADLVTAREPHDRGAHRSCR